MGYDFLVYQPRFKDQVIEIQKHLWGPNLSLNADYFAWKYLQNPFLEAPLIYLAVSRGKVAAMRGFMGAKWRFGRAGPEHACPIACDLVVDPDHRRRGLFRDLMVYALKDLEHRGYRYVFNLSANPANYNASLKAGWRLVTSYQTLRRETWHGSLVSTARHGLQKLPLLWRFSDHVAQALSGRNSRALDLTAPRRCDGWTYSIAERPEPRGVLQAAEADDRCDRFGPVTSPEYFSWRFRNPMHENNVLLLCDSRPRGYFALQRRRDDALGIVKIVDWAAEDSKIAKQLFLTVLAQGRFPSLSIWSATLGEDMKAMLRAHGFKAFDETRGVPDFRPGLLIKALSDKPGQGPWEIDGRDLLDLQNWKLRMIYSDAH